jgi:hypothetical protein
MAEVNGTNYAKAIDPTPANILARGVWGGKLQVKTDVYELSSTAENTIINIANLNDGDKVVDVKIYFDDLGTGLTIDVGDSDTVDRYIDGADVATAAGSASMSDVDGVMYVVGTNDGDNIVQAKLLGGVGTGTLKTVVTYVQS